MPKNFKGGKGAKKGKNSALRVERALEKATEGQYYGICTKYYGNHRGEIVFYMKVSDGKDINGEDIMIEKEFTSMGIVRGSIRKRTRLRAGNVVIVAPRDYQLNKIDIIYMYNYDDFKKLKRTENIHPKILTNCESINDKSDENNNIDDTFNFDNIDSDDEDNSSKITRRIEKESYQSIYDGLPTFSEEDSDDIENI